MLKEAFILHLFYFVLDVRTAVRCYRRHFLAHPAAKATAEGRLMFCLCFFIYKMFLTILLRPIISTSAKPIFVKFARLVKLWL